MSFLTPAFFVRLLAIGIPNLIPGFLGPEAGVGSGGGG